MYKLRDMPVSELKDWMLYYEHKTKEMQAAQGKAGNADGSINLLENPEVLLKNFMGTS